MIRPLRWTLLVSVLVFAAPAMAQSKKPDDNAAKAADKAAKGPEKAGEKVADKADKAADKAGAKDGGADKAADKADDKDKDKGEKKNPPKSDKAAIKKKSAEEREKIKGKVTAALKGKPATPAIKNELKRHARTLARLERLAAVAKANGDDDTEAKAKKLIAKENDRHDKWLSKFDPTKEGAK